MFGKAVFNSVRAFAVLLVYVCTYMAYDCYAISDDASTDTINLRELKVEAKTVKIDSGVVTIYPTVAAKKLAKNINSLVELSNPGLFTIVNGKITVNGKPVTIAINGEVADAIDQKTFWAKNVLRIEYVEDPKSQSLQGQRQVLNLVMKEYVYGGLTRLEGTQEIPNNGDYTVSSKLVKQPITVNVFSEYIYDHGPAEKYGVSEDYSDVWYDGEHFSHIYRNNDMSSLTKTNDFSCGLNIRQKSKKFYSVHSVSFGTSRKKDNTQGQTTVDPMLFSGDQEQTIAADKNNRFLVKGEYRLTPSNNYVVTADWSVARNVNKNNRFYELNDEYNILTDIKESNWVASFKMLFAYRPNKKLLFNISFSDTYSKFKADYTGNTNSTQFQKYNIFDVEGIVSWTISRKFSLTLSPSLSIFSEDINHNYKRNRVIPSARFMSFYSINEKSTLSADLFYAMNTPTPTTLSDLVLQQDALKWIKGNPQLKPRQYYSFSADYFSTLLPWLNLTLGTSASVSTNSPVIHYYSGGEKYNGIVGEYVNGVNKENYQLNFSPTLQFMNSKIRIYPTFDISYERVKNVRDVFWFRTRLTTSFLIKNVALRASCYTPEKILLASGNEVWRTYWQYLINVDYSLGNFIFSAELNNIFSKYRKSVRYYQSPCYNYTKNQWDRGRYATISVTYTFDYGKKVDRSIEIQTGIDRNSSILSE